MGSHCQGLYTRWHQGVSGLPFGIAWLDDVHWYGRCIGMAVAKMWDTDWDIYSKVADLYVYMRDKRGYDAMDEYIREEVLLLQGADYAVLEKLTGECASRVYNALMHQRLEPGTKEAFNSYVACLHQLYLFGAAIQLKRMGYRMTQMN